MATKKVKDEKIVEEGAPALKKRARIVKKDSDRVYSASQDQGERFDSIETERVHKRAAVSKAKDDKAAAIHALETEVKIEPPKKKRGRPSKADLEAKRAYEEALARQQMLIAEAQAAVNGVVTGTPIEDKTYSDEQPVPTENKEKEAPDVETPEDDDIPEFIRMQRDAMAQQKEEQASEATTTDDDDDDVPEFIRMQREAQKNAAPSETSETAEQETAETFSKEKIVATKKTAEKPDKTETTSESKGRTLADAKADGQDFIIIKDIPIVEMNEFDFRSPAFQDAYEEPTFETPTKFHRFKDDVRVNGAIQDEVANSVLGAAQALVRGAKAQQSSQNPVETKPQPAPRRNREIIIDAEGVMELDSQGIGFLRSSDYNYMPSPDDVFVSQQQIRNSGLKTGDVVVCKCRIPKEGEKYYALTQVISINGKAPHQVRDRVAFEHLTPLFPDEQFRLSKRGYKAPLSCRIVDLFSPIGKGQRGLIVAQPKTGKTILMKQIANAIAANYPDTYLMMLLIDERPEEVTDMSRTVNAEVIASTFDEPAQRHVRIATMVLEKAKRMVECGHDVVIFLDSITRLARAFNTTAPASGKILTGGVDANALQKPKRFFGAARNIEGGGSLTIIATALIDTGSKMDEVIFEEFKGTGNMELQLDRNLANKRIFPAVNLIQSSTRREDLLLDETTVNRMFIVRNYMADMSPIEAMNFIKKRIEDTVSNEEFVATMDR